MDGRMNGLWMDGWENSLNLIFKGICNCEKIFKYSNMSWFVFKKNYFSKCVKCRAKLEDCGEK